MGYIQTRWDTPKVTLNVTRIEGLGWKARIGLVKRALKIPIIGILRETTNSSR